MTEKLKKCPFCGRYAAIYEDYHGQYLAQCKLCGVGTLHYHEKAEAIAAWNRRADDGKGDR